MDKKTLRIWAKDRRKKLDMQNLSEKLVNKIRKTHEYQEAKSIMIFYPKEYEVNLLSLLDDNKEFYLPKIDGKNLLCCPFCLEDPLSNSCFNTLEPISNPENIIPDLVIVPALAVDKKNYRLGYGGGFYDRFLKSIRTKTIVCIPQELVVDNIFPEEFDIPVNKIIVA